MGNFLRSAAKYIVIFSLISGCSTLSVDGPTTVFGGYQFKLDEQPTLIGASASDSLVLTFEDGAKLVFVFNHYKDFALNNLPLDGFIDVVYGESATSNMQLKLIKDEISKQRISSYQSIKDGFTVHVIKFVDKDKLILLSKDRTDTWVEIDVVQMDSDKLLDAMKAM